MILRIIILTSNLLQFGIFSKDNILELCFIFAYSRLNHIETSINKKFISELFLYCSINKFQKLSPLSYDQEVYTLYRGTAECEDEENVYWHSWTDSYNSSLGFAFRINVRKGNILFCTDVNHEHELFISTDDEFGKKSISPEIYIELSDDPLADRFEKNQFFHFDFIPLVL
ncbi:hypothetical protein [uncultured Bilophila sp.]|uniref:hypothetical protein n=1 Tax=uncultured Bilophila sp. TaxID=529385 RepID=UPI00266FAD78|nr:hypothetical protein [uncultured Bilophila sp.]